MLCTRNLNLYTSLIVGIPIRVQYTNNNNCFLTFTDNFCQNILDLIFYNSSNIKDALYTIHKTI